MVRGFKVAAMLGLLCAGAAAQAHDWIIANQAQYDQFRTGKLPGEKMAPVPASLQPPADGAADSPSMVVLSPGDQLLFMRGQVFTGPLHLTRTGTGMVTVSATGIGAAPVIDGRGARAAVTLYDSGQWRIANLDLRNTDDPVYPGAIKRAQSGLLIVADNTGRHPDITVEHNIFRDIQGYPKNKDNGGIVVIVTCDNTIKDQFLCDPVRTPSAFDNLHIIDNLFHDIGGLGIRSRSVWQIGDENGDGVLSVAERRNASANSRVAPQRVAATGVLVAGNRLYNIGRNAITVGDADGPVIEHNTIGPNTSYGDTGNTIFTFATDDAHIRYNEAFGNRGTFPGQQDRGGIDADFNARRTYIEYNYLHDNDFAFAIMKKYNDGVFIHHNLTVDNRDGLVYFGFPTEFKASGIEIYNNTIMSAADGYQVFLKRPSKDGKIRTRWPIHTSFTNNLVLLTGKDASWGWDPYPSPDRRATADNRIADNIILGMADPGPGARNLPGATPDQLIAGPMPAVGDAPAMISFDDPDRLAAMRTCAGSPAIGGGSDKGSPEKDATDFWGHTVTWHNIGADGTHGVDCTPKAAEKEATQKGIDD